MRFRAALCALAAFAVLPGTAWAADRTPLNLPDSASSKTPADPSSSSLIIRVVIAVAVVCLAVYALYRLLKWLSHRSGPSAGPAVQIISRTPAGRDAFVTVCRLGDRVVVYAQGQGHSEKLREMTVAQAQQEGLAAEPGTAARDARQAAKGFAAALGRARAGGKEPGGLASIPARRKAAKAEAAEAEAAQPRTVAQMIAESDSA